jgi:LCP family protein required for cell wall assembly
MADSVPGGRLRGRRPRYHARHGRPLRRWPRRLLVAVNLVVFVIIAVTGAVVGYGAYELSVIHRVTVPDLQAPKPDPAQKDRPEKILPFTMLIVGSDTRALAGQVGASIGNTTTNPEDLSDSIILARVDPSEHKLALLSIPRDLFVSIPGIGVAKINAAFSGNDPSRLIQVITDDLGIAINHYADVNFYSFEQIADAIGGVEQYFPTPAYDLESDLEVPKAGCVNLKGAQALAFVRSRNYFFVRNGVATLQLSPESDLGRIQRQQAFIKNAIEKVERTDDLTNPVVLTRLVSAVTKNLTVDSRFSDGELIALAEDFSKVDANAIPNLTYPVVNSGNGLDPVPAADAATVAEFENLGSTAPAPTTSTTPTSRPGGTAAPSTAAPSTTAPASTTTEPQTGNAYSSGTQIVPTASSYYDGVYIPPGRVPGEAVQTCGD